MNIYSLYYSKWIAGDYRPNITAYYSIEWNGFHMPPHRHNQVEIMYVFGGTCLIDAMGKSCTLEKGDFILIDAGVPHGLEVGRDLKCRMLNIEFTFVGGRASTPTIRQLSEEVGSFALLLRDKPPFLLARDYYDLHSPLKNIIMELDDRKNGTLMLAELYMSEILIKLSRAYDDSRTKSFGPGSLYVRNAVNFIHQHYDQDIKIKDLAAHLNIHEGYLHRIFKGFTGKTPNEYLTDLRLDKAKMLLRHTDIKISDISDYVGINSRQYFTAIFKKHTGKTPSEYRKSVERWVNMSSLE
jgi:AraC-like DNA-binding protein